MKFFDDMSFFDFVDDVTFFEDMAFFDDMTFPCQLDVLEKAKSAAEQTLADYKTASGDTAGAAQKVRAVGSSVLQCVAVCCSVLQCVAVCGADVGRLQSGFG